MSDLNSLEDNQNIKLINLSNLSTYTTYIEEKNIQVTNEEYELLPSSKLTDNVSYYIKDKGIIYKNGTVYGQDSGDINVQSNQNETTISSDAYIKNKPSNISVFINDSGFITKAVNDLTNYYNKTNNYSKTEIDNIISTTEDGRFVVVSTLPTTNIRTDVIYLLPKTTTKTDDTKDEYINLDGTTGGQEKIGSTDIDLSGYYTSSQINTLLSNSENSLETEFQTGVDSIYNAIVNKGSTPSSKSLSDILTGVSSIPNSNSGTYTADTRSSSIDMGANNTYRYLSTSNVPNSNSGTQNISANGITDMTATNDKRYVNVNVSNSNSGTYTFAANDTGGIKDLGATNSYRYINAENVYTKGKTDGKADHSATYTPTSRASNNDMGATHSYRYVNTNSVPNSNSGTYDVTSNGVKDMGATNDKRYVNVNVSNSNSGTYTFAANDTGGIKDMGSTNTYRYVVATNVYAKGKADGKANHSATYTPTSRASNLDMGQTHSYRYVNTNSVPNSKSGTYATITTNGTHDMTAGNSYRYVTVNVPHPTHTTTYTPTSRASNLDMGATNSYRYVNTNSVPNVSSGTYGSITSNGTKDMGATNSYRYVNVNVSNSNSGTASYTDNGVKDMGATNSYRYVNINVPDTHNATYNNNTIQTSNVYGNTFDFSPADLGINHRYRYINNNLSISLISSGTQPYNVSATYTTNIGAGHYLIFTYGNYNGVKVATYVNPTSQSDRPGSRATNSGDLNKGGQTALIADKPAVIVQNRGEYDMNPGLIYYIFKIGDN